MTTRTIIVTTTILHKDTVAVDIADGEHTDAEIEAIVNKAIKKLGYSDAEDQDWEYQGKEPLPLVVRRAPSEHEWIDIGGPIVATNGRMVIFQHSEKFESSWSWRESTKSSDALKNLLKELLNIKPIRPHHGWFSREFIQYDRPEFKAFVGESGSNSIALIFKDGVLEALIMPLAKGGGDAFQFSHTGDSDV